MIHTPYRFVQWSFSGFVAAALACLLLLAPDLLKQDIELDSISRIMPAVSLRKLAPKPEVEEEVKPKEDKPKPDPVPDEPIPLMTMNTPPAPPIQPEILHLDIGANLAQAMPVSIPKHSGILSLGQVDEPPLPVFTPPPNYPSKARRRRLESHLMLKLVIDSKGDVRKVEIVSGEHLDVFRKPAIKTIQRWRFKPARLKGKPVAVLVTLPLEFTCTN